MATTSTSKQLVNFGATVVGGVALTSAVGGISKGISAYNTTSALNAMEISGAAMDGSAPTLLNAGQAAVDATTASFTSTMSSTFTNPAFLTSVGLGVAGILLGSGSKRPSLALPNILATAGVALSVGALLKQGQASAAAIEAAKAAAAGINSKIGGTIAMPRVDPAVYRNDRDRETGMTNVAFPADLGDDYYIRLSIHKYQRLSSDGTQQPGNPHTVIRLPIPTSVVDAIKLTYQDLNLGMFGGPVLDAINRGYDVFRQGTTSGRNMAGLLGDTLGTTSRAMVDIFKDPNFAYALGRRLMQNSPTISSALDMMTGNVPNPHTAVTFQGINLRKHTYTWRLSPVTAHESLRLKGMINALQRASLPSVQGTKGLLLNFPDMVTVQMQPTLLHFQPCMIDSVVVNYMPSGVPAFFANPNKGSSEGDNPVEVELSITLREISIHHKDMDYYRRMEGIDFGNPIQTEQVAPGGPPITRTYSSSPGP